MSDQSHAWTRAAANYEREYIDPYRPDVRNPLFDAIHSLADKSKTAADLGCGIGPLLPLLAERFGRVHAVDFAEGMLERARTRCQGLRNVEFWHRPLTKLAELTGQIDVAVAVNSLIMPDMRELEASLRAIRATLRPGGTFLAIVPGMDAVHYYTMLLLDRALDRGMPLAQARKNAAHNAEHSLYDFAFGEFCYKGLEQHFWHPFEVRYRFRRAGFRHIRVAKVSLSWQQFTGGADLHEYAPPWDWFVCAEPDA
jgi:SAM-dependent methyltransferase